MKTLRGFADGAKERMREEMGPEFDEVDWRKLDPRQYDPRRIIREALVDEVDPARQAASRRTAATPRYRESAYEQRQRKLGKPQSRAPTTPRPPSHRRGLGASDPLRGRYSTSG